MMARVGRSSKVRNQKNSKVSRCTPSGNPSIQRRPNDAKKYTEWSSIMIAQTPHSATSWYSVASRLLALLLAAEAATAFAAAATETATGGGGGVGASGEDADGVPARGGVSKLWRGDRVCPLGGAMMGE
jgi:hypothetical protein